MTSRIRGWKEDRVAIDFMSTLASGLGSSFEPIVPLFIPVLLSLCARTNKVVVTRAKTCVMAIIETTQLPSILPFLFQSIKDKSATLRLAAAEGTVTCLNCFNPLDLEKEARALEIEAVIRATATDAQADIRAVGRKIFDAYKVLFPDRVDGFTAPLTPTIKKYLDIKTFNSKNPQPTLPRLTAGASLTSTLSVTSSQTQRPQTQRSKTYVRSTSTTTASATHSNTVINKPPRLAPPQKPADILPPQYVPVRPAQASRTAVSPDSTTEDTVQKPPLVRPMQQVIASSTSSTVPSRPPSANSIGRPRRLHQTPASAISKDESDGPRRVVIQNPVPEPKPRPRVVSTTVRAKPLPAESQSSNRSDGTKPSGSKVPGQLNQRQQSRPLSAPSTRQELPKPTSTSNTTTTAKAKQPSKVSPAFPASKIASERPTRVGGITQPTLAQLARVKATAKERTAARISSKLNTQSQGRRTAQVAKDVPKQAPHLQQTSIKPTSRPASRSGSATPTHIPLPLSPPPAVVPQDDNSIKLPPAELANSADENDLLRESDSELGDSTPRPLTRPEENFDDLKTPISALLSSIQRGFLFTPSSPLSPPDSYLERSFHVDDLPLATFPLKSVDHNGGPKVAHSKGTFMFGVGVGDIERTALVNVENRDV